MAGRVELDGKKWGRKRGQKKGLQLYYCKPLILLARPRGIEPLTKSLEGSCSVQLSYGRVIRMHWHPAIWRTTIGTAPLLVNILL
ncbi:hypothetical protein KL86DES1_21768 [uncultured Desulfovibrio sp.]|uniref:Uncharacterized protein n=1 Tax=uncultured Desulfovibrio sp. TaxID=167968 RepID=A0A212LA01_9BACT|nr:hypothetical protein KL86DES1_21768 [uncultured Desulfovibrio sp.]VZH34669.1 conserved protein of unknown function [Desulfovibrio sp. 86]